MCGISGFINYDTLSIEMLIAFNNTIKHRGPDGEGFWVKWNDKTSQYYFGKDTPNLSKNDLYNYLPEDDVSHCADRTDFSIAFAHRRLSIVDLSYCGHQPMASSDDEIVITYNGEVYNYKEIRDELIALGYSFRSKTDTEVIINAYKEWGIDCLHKFNGMFAFLLYDKTQNKLFAIRDRFGVKPLYYYRDGDSIAFASEIKQFTTLPNWEPELNYKTAKTFLWSGTLDYSEDTLFKSVHQVSPAHYLEIDLNSKKPNIKKHRWHDIRKIKTSDISYDDAVTKFKKLFFDAVDLRLKADVKVCTGLSGGLDSSSIVCTSNQLNNKSDSHCTFSARSEDAALDEDKYIQEVIKTTDVTNIPVWPKFDELISELQTIIWHQDEPFGGMSYFAEWCIYKSIHKNNLKVSLEGHGADELLLGYHYNFSVYLNTLFKRGKFISAFRLAYRIYKQDQSKFSPFVLRMILILMPHKIKKLLAKKSAPNKQYFLDKKLEFYSSDFYLEHQKSSSDLKQYSLEQFTRSSLPQQIHSADRSSMAFSIESRAPFLDYRIAEFLYTCPSSFKLEMLTTKRILRDSMKGVLPDSIRTRASKIGFAAPEEKWVRDNKITFQSIIEEIRLRYPNFISETLYQDFCNMIDGSKPYNVILWRVICFYKWLDIFHIPFTPEEHM